MYKLIIILKIDSYEKAFWLQKQNFKTNFIINMIRKFIRLKLLYILNTLNLLIKIAHKFSTKNKKSKQSTLKTFLQLPSILIKNSSIFPQPLTILHNFAQPFSSFNQILSSLLQFILIRDW